MLKNAGLDIDIKAHVRRGGYVLGLCGGYQMLGKTVADPDGIEGPSATVACLDMPSPQQAAILEPVFAPFEENAPMDEAVTSVGRIHETW